VLSYSPQRNLRPLMCDHGSRRSTLTINGSLETFRKLIGITAVEAHEEGDFLENARTLLLVHAAFSPSLLGPQHRFMPPCKDASVCS